MSDTEVRLNKHLALQLGVSRREADEMIEQGRVRVGKVVAELGGRIDSSDQIFVDDKPLRGTAALQTILFHKPVGYVCSRKAQGENPTIYDLLPPGLHALKPVGRLDKDSSGLLLLTNDGDLAHQMTHPSFRKAKVYQVRLNTPLQPLHQQMISDFGVMLDDGKSQFLVEKSDQRHKTNEYKITMREGRNRQIRRTFTALGYSVITLHRIQFGKYSLDSIAAGMWKQL